MFALQPVLISAKPLLYLMDAVLIENAGCDPVDLVAMYQHKHREHYSLPRFQGKQ